MDKLVEQLKNEYSQKWGISISKIEVKGIRSGILITAKLNGRQYYMPISWKQLITK